jgi:hypothetical protein
MAAVGLVVLVVVVVGTAVQARSRRAYADAVAASYMRAVAVRSRDESPAEVWARLSRTGWRAAIDAGRLVVVAGPVPDPGNPGNVLHLVADPLDRVGRVHVLVGIDPATGTEVALPVPAEMAHPLQAAAWTYTDPAHAVNPSPEVYADLTVRT